MLLYSAHGALSTNEVEWRGDSTFRVINYPDAAITTEPDL
jgi:hypothetical protein